jgi:hypothetical protein
MFFIVSRWMDDWWVSTGLAEQIISDELSRRKKKKKKNCRGAVLN